MGNEDRITCPSINDGWFGVQTQLVPCSEGGVHNIPVGDRPIIPIVFLPGIMGSNLRNKKTKKPVWYPGRGSGFWTWWKYEGFTGTTGEERQTLLDMNNTEVYPDGAIDNGSLPTPRDDLYLPAQDESAREPEEALKARGWGTVFASSYHPFMTRMQYALNNVFASSTKLEAQWEKCKTMPSAEKYGMSDSLMDLNDGQLVNLSLFRYHVWACGYNWLRSNVEAAEYVKDFIERMFRAYDKAKEEAEKKGAEGIRLAARKVILVTHSMGGLVARQLCSDAGGGRDLVLGVVHGAQPSNGAGEAYTNLRWGVQGDGVEGSMKASAIGNSTATLAPVFSQCLGGLQLLPFGFNNAYNPYVEYYKKGVQTCMRLHPPPCLSPKSKYQTAPGAWIYWDNPEKGLMEHSGGEKIYDEIYKCELDPEKPDWHRLLPRHNMRYFDPAGILPRANEDTPSHEIFNGFINQVWKFHKNIVGYYHPTTYAFWSAGTDTAATGEALWQWSRHMEWRGDMIPILTPVETPERDTGKGEYMQGRDHYTLHDVKHPGDTTVPRASWQRDLSAQSMKGYCLLGDTEEDPKGFTHQNAFNDFRAQDAALYFLAKLVSSQVNELMKKEPKQ